MPSDRTPDRLVLADWRERRPGRGRSRGTPIMDGRTRGRRLVWPAAALALGIAIAPPAASAQFTLSGKKVPPTETNFAGVRQVSPRYGLIVQINHDARTAGDFEIGLLDETYAALLRQFRRGPTVPTDLLPVVFVSEVKLARFGERPWRRMFRWLEPELRRHPDLHLSPAAIFISDQMLADQAKLRSALARGLGLLFDQRLGTALGSVEQPTPDK